MANVKISQLPLATSPLDSTVEMPVVQGGVTKRAGMTTIGFLQSGTGAVLRTAQNKMRDIVSVKDFGAVGNGVADDTAAVTSAINFAMSETYSPALYFSAGYYRIAGTLPNITNAVTLVGDGPRDTQLQFSGTGNAIKIIGSGARATDVVLQDLMLNGNAMTGGYLVEVDWAQNIKFLNVSLNNPFNGVSLRQCGNILFQSFLADAVRGAYGVYAYGANTSRNGENDQIDLVQFTDSVIQSNYVAGGPVPTADLLVLDGRVHTVNVNGLRLLSAKRALVTLNTPALAQNFVPRFITGTALEAENHYAACFDLQAATDVWIDNIFAAGSFTSDGVVMTSSVANVGLSLGSVNSNNLSGININGAKNVELDGVSVYNNSLVGANVKSGVNIAGSGRVTIIGGLLGKATYLPAYTELQKYGVDLDPGFSGVLLASNVDVRNNSTGALFDNGVTAVGSKVDACAGYNPLGPATQVVGASPFAYTAGLTVENINLYAGSGVTVAVGGITIANVSPCSFTLQPRQTATITYLTVPTMAINRA